MQLKNVLCAPFFATLMISSGANAAYFKCGLTNAYSLVGLKNQNAQTAKYDPNSTKLEIEINDFNESIHISTLDGVSCQTEPMNGIKLSQSFDIIETESAFFAVCDSAWQVPLNDGSGNTTGNVKSILFTLSKQTNQFLLSYTTFFGAKDQETFEIFKIKGICNDK